MVRERVFRPNQIYALLKKLWGEFPFKLGDTVTNSIESHVHFLSLSKRKKFRHIFNSAMNLFSFNNGDRRWGDGSMLWGS